MTIYPRGKGSTYELYSSPREADVASLFKNYIRYFGYFSWLVNVASPSTNEHGTWWASNIRPSIVRWKPNHFTTTPLSQSLDNKIFRETKWVRNTIFESIIVLIFVYGGFSWLTFYPKHLLIPLNRSIVDFPQLLVPMN